MTTKNLCPCLNNASALAHKRGLLEKKQRLVCEFEDSCDHVECKKLDAPNYRTIEIVQGVDSQSLSPLDRFYGVLGKHQEVVRERG